MEPPMELYGVIKTACCVLALAEIPVCISTMAYNGLQALGWV